MNSRVCLIMLLLVSASMMAMVGPSDMVAASGELCQDIVIEGDSELENNTYLKTGTGTLSDPYVISDLDMGAHGIRISNTTCHIELSNINFDEGTGYGIELYQTYYVTMRNISSINRMNLIRSIGAHNTTFRDSRIANIPNGALFIHFKNSWGSKLLNCEIGSKHDAMITFYRGYDTEIRSNVFRNMTVTEDDIAYNDEIHDNVFNNSHLIVKNGHSYPSVHDNDFFLDEGYGMTIDHCRQFNVYNNSFKAPIGLFFPPTSRTFGEITSSIYQCIFIDCGVGIGGANDGNPTRSNGYDIIDNIFKNCSSYAIDLFASKFVRIYRNLFIDNNGVDEDPSKIQCAQYPYGSWNDFPEYDKEGLGNYWSDHTGPDEDGNGIVDDPYNVPFMGQDNYPCTNMYFDVAKPDLCLHQPDEDTKKKSYLEIEWDAVDIDTGLKDLKLITETEEYDVLNFSSSNLFLKAGTQKITLSAMDRAGITNSTSIDVLVHETNEVFEVLNYGPGDIIHHLDNYLRWKVHDYFPVADQTLEINGEPITLPSEVRSYPLDLAAGSNRITLKIHDGQFVERTISMDLIMDKESPKIEVLSPSPGATYTNEYLSLVWSVSDNLKLDTVQWRLDGEEWKEASENMDGLVPFDEGAHLLNVKASDLAGSITEVEVPFTIGVDTDLRIISPVDSLETNSKYLDLKWEYSGSFEWTRAQLRIGSNSEYRDIDSFEASGIRIQDYSRNANDGVYDVSIRLLDEHGNHIKGSRSIILDTEAPKVLFDEPPGFPNLAASDLHVSWRGYEENTLNGYRVKIDDEEWKDVGKDTRTDLKLEDGQHVLKVEAHDLAGNIRVCSLEFNIDSTPPMIHTLAPSNGEVIKDGYVDLNWHIAESGNIEKALILLDGEEIRNATGLSRRSFLIGEAGEHTISIVVWDDSGNKGSVDIPVIVDLDPADIEWTSVPDPLSSLAEWTIEWEMDDDVGIDFVMLKSNENEMLISEDMKGSEIQFSDGDHVLELTVVDLGGHSSYLKYEFKIDTRAPSVFIDRERTEILDGSVDIYYTVGDDLSGIRSIEIKVDDGNYEHVISDRIFSSDILEEGNHIIIVKAEDEAGNIKEEMYHFDITGMMGEDPSSNEGTSALMFPLATFLVLLAITTSGWFFLRRRRSRDKRQNILRYDRGKANGPVGTNLLPAPSSPLRNDRCLPPANNFIETVQGVNYHRPDNR